MGYRLKSGLSKSAVYKAVQDHNTSGVALPSLRNCEFQKYRNSYWLYFGDGTYGWEVFFCQFAGSVCFRFTRSEYSEIDGSCHYTDYSLLRVPFKYCLDQGMLREVA